MNDNLLAGGMLLVAGWMLWWAFSPAKRPAATPLYMWPTPPTKPNPTPFRSSKMIIPQTGEEPPLAQDDMRPDQILPISPIPVPAPAELQGQVPDQIPLLLLAGASTEPIADSDPAASALDMAAKLP